MSGDQTAAGDEVLPPLVDSAQLVCSVCGAALPVLPRGTAKSVPGYRKLLACTRAGVCIAHLGGDHIVRGVRSRYCTNHHALHPVAAFSSAHNVTCARARALSTLHVRSKRQKSSRGGRGGGEAQGGAPPLLPQPRRGAGGVAGFFAGLFSGQQGGEPWPADDADGGEGEWVGGESYGLDAGLLTSLGLAAAEGGGDGAVSLLPAADVEVPPVSDVCASINSTARYLDILAFHSASTMSCLAGRRAQEYSEQHSGAAMQFAMSQRLMSRLYRRQSAALELYLQRLVAVVDQARADEAAMEGDRAGAGRALAVLLDNLIATSLQRDAVLCRVINTTLSTAAMRMYFDEVKEANCAQRRNLLYVAALIQGAALCATRLDYPTIVRLCAQHMHGQTLKTQDAMAQRMGWIGSLSVVASGRKGVAATCAASVEDIVASLSRMWEASSEAVQKMAIR